MLAFNIIGFRAGGLTYEWNPAVDLAVPLAMLLA